MRRIWQLGLALLGMAALFAVGWLVGYQTTVKQIAERGVGSLTLVTERLNFQLDKFRFLPAVLAADPAIKAVLVNEFSIDRGNRLLQRISDTAGALDIYVMDTTGHTIAASNWDLDRSFLGQNFAWRPYFRRAVKGGLGLYHAVGTTSGQRGFFFSHPVQNDAGKIVGVIAVKVDLERIETQWRADPQDLFITDSNGVVFLSNRRDLVLTRMFDGAIDDPRRYAGRVLGAFPAVETHNVDGWEIWETEGDPLKSQAVFLSQHLPRIDMTAHVLVDVAGARTQAALWGGLAAMLGGFLMLALAILHQRRASMTMRLAIEARARNELEDKVAERTAALKQVQAELVQAGKLTALGEMSAGISHELNQPLTAIQSLADNVGILLDRQKNDDARSNVDKISKLAGRMGRIIRNLRAFARKEGEEVTEVDIVEVVNDALGIASPRLQASEVTVAWSPPDVPVRVLGGRVRLQQVLVNLISNAIDAMQGKTERAIEINVIPDGEEVTLRLRDTGPGLDDPESVFDPFYTTKTVGEGLGLGLSISYGIVQSFGGNISGTNDPDGGAVFSMKLRAAENSEAFE